MAPADNIGPLIGRGYYAEVFSYGEDKVVKLFDDGRDVDSAEHEARLTTVARESGIPVPKIYDVVTVNDRVGIVMERIDGETMIQWGTSLPWRVYTGASLMARLHADMHSRQDVDIPQPQEEMLDRIRNAPGVDESVKRQVIERLATLPDGDSFYHGDFHPGNIMMARGNPVIIDWESGTSAHQASDVGAAPVRCAAGAWDAQGDHRNGAEVLPFDVSQGVFQANRHDVGRCVALASARRGELHQLGLPPAPGRSPGVPSKVRVDATTAHRHYHENSLCRHVVS